LFKGDDELFSVIDMSLIVLLRLNKVLLLFTEE
jgi:hypothetical protein